MEVQGDWLHPTAEQDKEATRVKALEFAQLYMIFKDGRGKQLLDYWDATVRRKRIPVNASIQEYAAQTALREFIEGMHDQIKLAESESFRF